jgi:hypothetical protein
VGGDPADQFPLVLRMSLLLHVLIAASAVEAQKAATANTSDIRRKPTFDRPATLATPTSRVTH